MLKAMKMIVAIVMVTLVALTSVALPSYAEAAQTTQKQNLGFDETRKGINAYNIHYQGVLLKNGAITLSVLNDNQYRLTWTNGQYYPTKVSHQLKGLNGSAPKVDKELTSPRETMVVTPLIATNNFNEITLKNESAIDSTIVSYDLSLVLPVKER